MGYLEDLMGAATAASGVKEDNNNKFEGFSEKQTNQLLLAQEYGVTNTECLKHKEWSPDLMNICWCREKDGNKPENVCKMGRFLQEHFPLIGGFVGAPIDIMLLILKCYDNEGTPWVPDLLSDGSIDKESYIFKMIVWELGGLNAECLLSGRYRLMPDTNFDVLEHVMAEGDKEVLDILRRLQDYAQSKSSSAGFSDIMTMSENNAWNRTSIMLCFDDMNIRGYQIRYALEYTDGSEERLFKIIDGKRSADLCRYINKKSAEDYKYGIKQHNQIAVTGGASFMYNGSDSYIPGISNGVKELVLTAINVDTYLNDNIEALKVDYSSLDIKSSIDSKTAIKICEARGFDLIKDVCRKSSIGSKVHYYIFYNRSNNDYIVAHAAEDSDFVYGGADLIMHRDVEACKSPRAFWIDASGSPHRNQPGRCIVVDNNDGLFSKYSESLECLPGYPYDWGLIGFGYDRIPIPEYIELPMIRDDDLFRRVGGRLVQYLYSNGCYVFGKILNGMLLLSDEELVKAVPEHYGLYKDWYFERAGALDTASWYAADDTRADALFSIAAAYLKMPEELVNRVINGGLEKFRKLDRAGDENGTGLQATINGGRNEKDFLSVVSDRLYRINEQDAQTVIKAFNLPGLKELPVYPYWLK